MTAFCSFNRVTMDWIELLPCTVCGYNTVYTTVDRFSKLVRYITCKTDVNAKKASCFFLNVGFTILVCPKNLLVIVTCRLLENSGNS